MRAQVAVALLPLWAGAWDNGLARTPPRGFATWNIWPFTSQVNRTCSPPTCDPMVYIERSVNQSQCAGWAQALVDTGLAREGGFEYFIVQEPCFGPRDPLSGELTQGGEFGDRWPDGMGGFGRFLHQRGMRLGIYTDIGPTTCGRCVGSFDHVRQDMLTFAGWGADLVEVDACNGDVAEATWAEYRDAINATGRPMVHSVCAEGMAKVWTWGMRVGNFWRVNGDIQNGWLNVVQGLDGAMSIPHIESYAGPGGWNSMDMLEIGARPGNYSWGGPGLTEAEAKAHFTLWSVLKSPLLLGADPRLMSEGIVDILKNPELKAIHQDPLGRQARRLDSNFPGYHAANATAAVLRPCNRSDPQQLFGSSYGQTVDIVAPGTKPPIPRVRSAVASTHCLSASACQPDSPSSPLVIRQCDDWTGDSCSPWGEAFAGQIFRPVPGADGSVQLVANVSTNNTDRAAAKLCVSVGASNSIRLEPCEAGRDTQRWVWDIDPQTSGDAHPSHPGTLIASAGSKGMCLSTNFSVTEMNEVYIGELANGGWVVVMFNRTPMARTLTIELSRLGSALKSWKLRDIWAKKDTGELPSTDTLSRLVEAHSVVLLRLDPNTTT